MSSSAPSLTPAQSEAAALLAKHYASAQGPKALALIQKLPAGILDARGCSKFFTPKRLARLSMLCDSGLFWSHSDSQSEAARNSQKMNHAPEHLPPLCKALFQGLMIYLEGAKTSPDLRAHAIHSKLLPFVSSMAVSKLRPLHLLSEAQTRELIETALELDPSLFSQTTRSPDGILRQADGDFGTANRWAWSGAFKTPGLEDLWAHAARFESANSLFEFIKDALGEKHPHGAPFLCVEPLLRRHDKVQFSNAQKGGLLDQWGSCGAHLFASLSGLLISQAENPDSQERPASSASAKVWGQWLELGFFLMDHFDLGPEPRETALAKALASGLRSLTHSRGFEPIGGSPRARETPESIQERRAIARRHLAMPECPLRSFSQALSAKGLRLKPLPELETSSRRFAAVFQTLQGALSVESANPWPQIWQSLVSEQEEKDLRESLSGKGKKPAVRLGL